jgi:hypothetical protein
MKWTLAYVLGIVAVNLAFKVVPPLLQTPWGPVTLGSIIVGGLLIARDRAQDDVGKWWVLAATGLAALLSYATASPVVAGASWRAFLVSEVADWAVYTPLRRRSWLRAVVASQVVGAALDSAVFLLLMDGRADPAALAVMWASKLAALAALVAARPAGERAEGFAP